MTAKPWLSVIVPVYNETARLGNLKKIARYLAALPVSSELIVVDDGSRDDTLAWLRKNQSLGFQLLSYPRNRGKGYAIKQGMLQARGKYRLFMDVDLSVPLEHLAQFLPHLEKFDLVFATRKSGTARVLVKQSLVRETLGKGFTLISRACLGLPVSDFTCGFKGYSAQAARQLFTRARVERWGFDSELMFLAKKLGLRHKEVPVVWKNDPRTKVRFPQDIIRSLLDIVAIRWHSWRGRY